MGCQYLDKKKEMRTYYIIASAPLLCEPMSIASTTSEMKILPSPADPGTYTVKDLLNNIVNF